MALLKQSSRIKRFEYDDAAASEYHFFLLFLQFKVSTLFSSVTSKMFISVKSSHCHWVFKVTYSFSSFNCYVC